MNSSYSFPTDGNITVTPIYEFIGLSIIMLVVSLPLNIYASWLIITGARTGVASEFFPLNLCVCEIIICSSLVCGILKILVCKNDDKTPIHFSLAILSSMHNISRPFFQCCVCVERYVAMIHPIIFLKYKPLRYRTVWSMVAWIIILGFSVSSSFIQVRDVFYYILLPEYIAVFSIKILCSVALLKALRKPGPGELLHVKDVESNQIKKKAFRVISIILVFMLITYCPMMMLMFMYDSSSNTQKWMVMSVFSFFAIVSGFVHPFLYLHRVGKIPFIPDLCF